MPARSAPEPIQATELFNTLGEFIASPPDGTPPEIVEALARMGGNGADPLPPVLFFEAVEQSPIAISITDAQATILYVNQAFEALTGYRRDAVLGHNQSLLSNNATPKSVYEQLWRTILARQTWSGTLVNRTQAGGDYLAELTITPVLDRDGALKYFLGMHRDVTKEHELEGALHQQKARLETVLDAAPVIVALLDSAGRVILDNQEYKRLLGELHGREPAEVFRAALGEQLGLDPFAACLEHGRAFKNIEVSLDIRGPVGTRWFACSLNPVDESDASARSYFGESVAGERRLLLLANDITSRRREIERAHLEHLRARLAEQQLMHGMREALAAAVYQIQVPLNVIQAASGMLRDGAANTETLTALLDQINASGAKALATLTAALPEEPREAGVRVNINKLLRQVLELETQRLLAGGIVVDWRPATLLPELTGHKNQLRAMFKHLIDNAIQALREAARPQRELTLTTRPLDGGVEIEIQDNGCGIAAEDRYRVFEPFHIGWRDRRGRSGMGLALAQEIVNAHGGSIEVDPEFSGGCLIRLSLNAAAADD
ncbi:nitrogen fixation negative regulator NifL [Allochromatium warmingii]|uniref:histidine kinase n=1 Tax=Allochromatium warmingii TaxID=61595 RepID=A0A1H3DNK7_ALLWA|nr:nitrogen fixation negative regulator NifL [Allochromatium warmingii]SDX67244.1 nitrogen fixation negative regulator NifL [Allochromatium warmingii]